MSETLDYELLDFGQGRKLERFGAVTVDRPSPAADRFEQCEPERWPQATMRFERETAAQGRWTPAQPAISPWTIATGATTLELRTTDSGQVGVFPEQADNWRWIAERVRQADQARQAEQGRHAGRPLNVLNLFAYTGASTLAAAVAGAAVAHVDAARSAVNWARANAAHSGLVERPIRWIVEDARAFVRRELKRGRSYDAVVLDPPSYGHGSGGQSWQFDRDLPGLLDDCRTLTGPEPAFVLLSSHTP
ncbi:MAG TPA: class I SAM-dependent methyltransferase, partial [Pirellulales bacterium]|nr:class I SAM-dependent methyltransferase [Pirellulales bacterium]